ncbi:MAG: cytochrome d ubiquinol oxidase subunit II [Actinobacteria bacterium]|nr:cytochrome d ubiquinol oxidase subunit II [Actinomycetota bacterium]
MLQAAPLVLALVGLALYVVLGGADFGAGLWQLLAGRGARGERIREHAHAAMAPVWEANHVWLIFVLVVMWTCYPVAFGSIVSTLAIPLFVAAVGIIFRGTAYALRAGTSRVREQRAVDTAFGIASVLTPFALGTVVGAIADGAVPVGNAAGDLWTSWTGAVPLTIGVMAVALGAYLAAVYLAADAVRRGTPELERAFRARALAAGVLAGALAVAGLLVVRADARSLYDGLVGDALPALVVSGAAGLATLALVWVRRYEAARYSAAVAVAAVVAGWAVAQQPVLLPGLTVSQAAASDDVLVAVLVSVGAGTLVLAPSLALLFTLTLRGRLGYEEDGAPVTPPGPLRALSAARAGLLARVALACLVLTVGFLTLADAGWAHAVGVLTLFAAVVTGFRAALPVDAP